MMAMLCVRYMFHEVSWSLSVISACVDNLIDRPLTQPTEPPRMIVGHSRHDRQCQLAANIRVRVQQSCHDFVDDVVRYITLLQCLEPIELCRRLSVEVAERRRVLLVVRQAAHTGTDGCLTVSKAADERCGTR